MFTVSGRPETPFKPVPGRVHRPCGDKAVGRADGKPPRRSRGIPGLRSVMAKAGSSARTMRFIDANGHADRVLDAPAPTCMTLAPRGETRRADGSHDRLRNRVR